MQLNYTVLYQFVYQYLWERPLDNLSRWQAMLITALRIVHLLIRDMLDGQINLRAMGLVYTTLLALVPLVAVSFSVLKGFGVHNQIEPMLLNLLMPLGEKGVEITERIIEFVDNVRVGVLGSLGLALLLYTVISLMQKIERALNHTWHVDSGRSLAHRFSDYMTIILVGPFLVFTALGITASVSDVEMVKRVVEIETIGMLLQFLARFLPYVMIIGTFTLVYILIPNTRVKVGAALVGGVVAGLMWKAVGWVFALFVISSTKYAAIYSAFATLIFFMIWLYLNWMILLIGGSVAFYVQHPEYRNLRSRTLRLSNAMREKLGLVIMAMVGRNYYKQRQALNLENLAGKLNVGMEACEHVVNRLVDGGILVPVGDNLPGYVPAYAPETMKLKDVVSVLRHAEESLSLRPQKLKYAKTIDGLYNDIEQAIEIALGDKSLRDLALTEDADDMAAPAEMTSQPTTTN